MTKNVQYLTKPFIVVWDIDTKIIKTRMTDNIQAWIPSNSYGKEFDTGQELDSYIIENNLLE